MASQTYALSAQRIGLFKGETHKRAQAVEITARWGRQIRMPKGMSDTYVGRRWLPHGATQANPNTFFGTTTLIDRGNAYVQAHQAQDGVTVNPDSITPQDFSVVVQEYTCLYGYTAKTAWAYEDAIPPEMEKMVGERIGRVNELVNYGAMKSTTNQWFGGTGTSIATVDGGMTLGVLQNVVRGIMAQHGEMCTTVLKPGEAFDTTAVEGGYVALISTDLEPDARRLDGFVPASKYASGTPYFRELGMCERIRFISTPDFPSRLNAGAAVGATGLFSTAGSNIDVYQVIIFAEDAWSQIAVRGMESAEINILPPGKIDKSDPNGQRGYAGALWNKAAMVENNGWIACLNVGRRVTT